jgi:imidazolonepropionase-like amidohydrolase
MLAIRAARLFDGVGSKLVEHAVVLVAEGRVVAIHQGPVPVPEAEVVELGDVTLLPGLIDAHVHLAFDASADPVGRLAGASDDELLAGARAAGRIALAAGITTVRDLGDRGYVGLRLRDELARDAARGPEVLAAGPPITTIGGHCWYLGGETDGVAAIRAAVRDRAARGVDVIKIMASGGELTPGTRSHEAQYTVDELRAAVEAAHRYGLPVTAHAHAVPGIANAVAAGADMVEHCSFFTEDGVDVDPTVLDALARRRVTVSATLGLLPGPRPATRLQARLPAIVAALRQVHQAGVPLVCGSDGGVGEPKPHDVLPYALQDLVAGGFTPVEALRAATSTAAHACRVGGRKGHVAPGYDADLLAVRGNPLVDITALHSVEAVFRTGHRVR